MCKYLGDLHTDAKHSLSGRVIYTDAPKDYDGDGKISLQMIYLRLLWELGEIKLYVYKIM